MGHLKFEKDATISVPSRAEHLALAETDESASGGAYWRPRSNLSHIS